MVDLAYLKKQKISSGDYKKIFTAEPEEYSPQVKKLVDLLRDRSEEGYRNSLGEWKAYQAIDLAYDVPFNQTTATFVQNILSKNLSASDTIKELEKYGLSEKELFMEVENPKDLNKPFKILNPPIFYQVVIPLVKAYTAIRVASLYNERNTNPIIPVKPLKDTQENTLLCQIWADLINSIGTAYGYGAVLRQMIHQTCKYGTMVAFTREEWHCERQVVDWDGAGAKKTTIKEGLRYVMPHPSRMAFDLNYPATSINTDTGCEWGLHWSPLRFGDISDNPKYWNRKSIFPGTNWFTDPIAGNYFKEVYPCTLQFPIAANEALQRDAKVAAYNTKNDRDKAVFVSETDMKIIPKNYGLGDYNYPVWHRFTLAGHNTVIWAEPRAYSPMIFMGYDYDENAGRNSSLALEIIPWQDHIGNIISQMLLTAKQNLANIIFYNNQAVEKTDISKLANSGESKYRGMNFIGFDGLKFGAARIDVDKIFHNVQFNKQSIQEFLQMMPLMLNVMERVLQISAQDAGSSATHQQSKAEVLMTGGATKNRAAFTGSFIDEGIDAWARQHHDACLAYMDPEFSAQISSEIENVRDLLNTLGFKITGTGNKKLAVTGHKKKLRMEGFAASNRGVDPTHDKELAQVIFQTVGTVAQQPELASKIDPEGLMQLLERAAIFAGAPKDFKLPRLQTTGPGGIPPAIMEAMKQAQAATLQTVEEKIAKPAAEQSHQQQQELQAMQQAIKQLQGIYQIAAAAQDKLKIEQAKAQQDMQIKDAEFKAEQRRLDMEAQAKIQRETTVTGAKVKLKAQETAAKVHTDAAVKLAGAQQEATAQHPSVKLIESMAYKDTPDEIKRQIEAQAGYKPATGADAPPEKIAKIKAAAKPKPAAKAAK